MVELAVSTEPCPTVDLSSVAAGQSVQQSAVLQEAADLYIEHGCVRATSAFSQAFLGKLYDVFVQTYQRYFHDRLYDDAWHVGDKRTQIALRMEGPFNSPELYANHRIMPLLQYLLGNDLILGSMGMVVSLPGADAQHVHRDNPIIFNADSVYPGGDACIPLLPPYAITLAVPLVAVDPENGCTRLWPGTHVRDDTAVGPRGCVDPTLALGDCVLFDYRLMHRGMPNRSNRVRPLVYASYHRPWFRDASSNYAKTGAVIMPDSEYARVPDAHKHLFEWSHAENRRVPIAEQEPSRNDPCFCGSGLRYQSCHGQLGG